MGLPAAPRTAGARPVVRLDDQGRCDKPVAVDVGVNDTIRFDLVEGAPPVLAPPGRTRLRRFVHGRRR